MQTSLPSQPENKKLTQILDASLDVFLRFGYRKTSMGDVAEAADISRQGLYFHFATKEELFRATIAHAVAGMNTGIRTALGDHTKPLQQRLLEAFDLTTGAFIGKFSADAVDLLEATTELTGDLIPKGTSELQALICAALDESVKCDRSQIPDITTLDRVKTLFAVADGLKHRCRTREDFRRDMDASIRVILAPLKLRTSTRSCWFC